MNQKNKITVAAVAVVIAISVLYFWQQNKKAEESQNLQDAISPVYTTINETENLFAGDGFTFVFPREYIADSKGLWTVDGYQRHINPPEVCSLCQVPEVGVKTTISDKTVEQQIIEDYGLPGTTLAEMSEKTGIAYYPVKIGENDFIKITVRDMLDVTGYYTQHNNQIVAFEVYWEGKDNDMLKRILETFHFKK